MTAAKHVDVSSDTLQVSPQTAPISGPQSIPLPQIDSSSRMDVSQPVISIDTTQVPERVPTENPATEHADDEVEFVFSVPRRRKKRRRRLEFPPQSTHIDMTSPISSAKISVTHLSPDKSTAMVPLLSPGPNLDDINMSRCRSLHRLYPTTTSGSFCQPLNVLQSKLSESSPSHISQTIPFKIPPPWYAKSMPPPPSPTSPYYYSKSTVSTAPEQAYTKKRKHEENSYKYSNHVSPYVSPTSTYQSRAKSFPSHAEYVSVSDHTAFLDFLEDPNVPITFGGVPLPLPPQYPITAGWQEFSWKPSGYLPSRRPHRDMLPGVKSHPEWHCKYHRGNGESRWPNPQNMSIRNFQNQRFAQELVSPKSIPREIQSSWTPCTYPPMQEERISEPSPIPEKLPASITGMQPSQSSSMGSAKPMRNPKSVAALAPTRNISPSPSPSLPPSHASAADVRRRPSLYRIPAWQSSTDNNRASSSISLGERQNKTCNDGINDARALHSTIPQQAKSVTCYTPNAALPSLPRPTPQTSRQQMTSSNHPPNLIIDIAQTSQDTFPFAAVAVRHNKPIQKVFDTFSAIIQLPLLKEAADGRRYSPLGSERMGQYKDAKRAMEKANREKKNAKGIRKNGQ
ncbi:01b5dca2-0f86-4df0-ab91-68f315d7db85 [Sclerotinia trifoliorum]|uniref:01b5dca2-0f86-4df0-ab91-68f315d7db85 n=1 Tax=Sclerotinia trifoliorum TaxID=28548 RepID=A0A8H2W172_9HELO|nr:01b5dca2-0f86-4df0-ab91-68f315d7db85 [Sclerotinia trifoliorum]